VTPDLFGRSEALMRGAPLIGALDRLNRKYGRHTLFLAESLAAVTDSEEERSGRSKRFALPVHQRKKTIAIPHLGTAH